MKRLPIVAGAGLLAAIAAAGVAVAAPEPSTSAAGTCQVTVDRSQAAGSFRVDRQELASGECVCYVYTGPASQSADVEAQIVDVQARRDCGAAPVPLAEAASATGSKAPLITAGLISAGGVIAALASGGGNDSTGG